MYIKTQWKEREKMQVSGEVFSYFQYRYSNANKNEKPKKWSNRSERFPPNENLRMYRESFANEDPTLIEHV